MSASRIVGVLAIIGSLALVGCDGAVVPSPSLGPVATPGSTPTASAPGSAPNPSSVPASVAPAALVGEWSDAGSLVEPRNLTHLAVLGTHEILVVGSDWACGASTDGSDSVEIGDPDKAVWKKASSLSSLRDAPALVALADGRALLTGGAAGESIGWSAFSSTYLFDPKTGDWSKSGLLNTARTGMAAAVLADGRVVVAGGMFMDRSSPEPARVLDSSEIWDPGSGAWSRTGSLADTRWGASAVTLVDGRVLVVGGVASNESAPTQRASAEIFDPKAGRWSSAGSLTMGRTEFALAALPDGGALVIGGLGGSGTGANAFLSTVERFDPSSSTWSAAENLPYRVAGASAILLPLGHVLLAGGSVRPPEVTDPDTGTYVSGLTADAVLFDPATGSWVATAPMPSPRARGTAVVLADGSALIAGGTGSEGNPGDTPGCSIPNPQVVRYRPAR